MPPLTPVVLSGGSGTRLWPLSTPKLPKQFSPLFGDRSLFGLTLQRLNGLDELRPAIVVTGGQHQSLVEHEVEDAPVKTGVIIIEPLGRNTAPAVLAAAMVAAPEEVLVILPSDHLITDADRFRDAVSTAADIANEGGILTFGIRPTRPETGFGYIEMGPERGVAYQVSRFKEKPSESEAAELVADGRHLWNSGIFVARADQALAEARRLVPELLEGVQASLPDTRGRTIPLRSEFTSLEAISFDYAIMEKTESALVLPIDVGWTDVGSYRSLLEVSDRDDFGNHVAGDAIVSGVSGSYVKSTSRRVVVAGLDEVVVVETPDAVLVVPLDKDQEVRDLQARIDEE